MYKTIAGHAHCEQVNEIISKFVKYLDNQKSRFAKINLETRFLFSFITKIHTGESFTYGGFKTYYNFIISEENGLEYYIECYSYTENDEIYVCDTNFGKLEEAELTYIKDELDNMLNN